MKVSLTLSLLAFVSPCVQDVSEVASLHTRLVSSISRSDWHAVHSILTCLTSHFMTGDILSQTGLGVTVFQLRTNQQLRHGLPLPTIKQKTKTKTTQGAISPSPTVTAASIDLTSGHPLPVSSDSGSGSIDLTAEPTSNSPATPSAPLSPDSSLRMSIIDLVYRLLAVWRAQESKERERNQLGGGGGKASLIFADYSTLRPRIDTYKCLYYRITEVDSRETSAEKESRRARGHQLTPRDLPAARLAAELEGMLFKHYQQGAITRHHERAKRHGSDLLSSSSSSSSVSKDDTAVALLHTLPPEYLPHARHLATYLTQPTELHKLRTWVASHEDGYQPPTAETDDRRAVLLDFIQRTKRFG